jgi:hypothetical protein
VQKDNKLASTQIQAKEHNGEERERDNYFTLGYLFQIGD